MLTSETPPRPAEQLNNLYGNALRYDIASSHEQLAASSFVWYLLPCVSIHLCLSRCTTPHVSHSGNHLSRPVTQILLQKIQARMRAPFGRPPGFQATIVEQHAATADKLCQASRCSLIFFVGLSIEPHCFPVTEMSRHVPGCCSDFVLRAFSIDRQPFCWYYSGTCHCPHL